MGVVRVTDSMEISFVNQPQQLAFVIFFAMGICSLIGRPFAIEEGPIRSSSVDSFLSQFGSVEYCDGSSVFRLNDGAIVFFLRRRSLEIDFRLALKWNNHGSFAWACFTRAWCEVFGPYSRPMLK